MKKRLRYHRDVYFPDWSEEALGGFFQEIRENAPLTFSLHALVKAIEYCTEFGKITVKYLTNVVRKSPLEVKDIFEFYAKGEKVKKACFRYSFEGFPKDFVLVISQDAVVITIFLINKGDNHDTLNFKLYEKGK